MNLYIASTEAYTRDIQVACLRALLVMLLGGMKIPSEKHAKLKHIEEGGISLSISILS
jgi:hypothetical protein